MIITHKFLITLFLRVSDSNIDSEDTEREEQIVQSGIGSGSNTTNSVVYIYILMAIIICLLCILIVLVRWRFTKQNKPSEMIMNQPGHGNVETDVNVSQGTDQISDEYAVKLESNTSINTPTTVTLFVGEGEGDQVIVIEQTEINGEVITDFSPGRPANTGISDDEFIVQDNDTKGE